MTSVIVERLPFGTSHFMEAVADVFAADELTVSHSDPRLDADGPWQVFRSGAWAHATVRDECGNVLAHYTGRARGQESDQRFRTALAAVRERLHV